MIAYSVGHRGFACPYNDGVQPLLAADGRAESARQSGIDVEFVQIPFANHVYNQLAANSLGNQARRSITVRFLAERGLAPGGGR